MFDFVEEQSRIEGIKTLCILGDLTDAKDYHSAALANQVVSAVTAVAQRGIAVTILMGNHDYLRTGHAYFNFLSNIPGVRFVSTMWEDTEEEGATALWLPHTKTPAKDWADLDVSHFDFVFMHQTVAGAVSSNGMKMQGEQLPPWPKKVRVFSGDIHVPQVIGGVEYVGSPYPVHFGDKFKARAVLIDKRMRTVDLFMEAPQKLTVVTASVDELRRHARMFKAGDQIKLRVELTASEKHEWSRIRREALDILKTYDVTVHGVELRVAPQTVGLAADTYYEEAAPVRVSDRENLKRFVAAQDLGGDALDFGLDLVPDEA